VIAGIWLVGQLAMLAASPLVLACGHAAAMLADAEDEDACCKGLAPGQMCPMHKHRAHSHHSQAGSVAASSSSSDASRNDACRLRSTCDPLDLAIESLLPGSGLLPQMASVADDLTVRSISTHLVTQPLTRTIAPDLPPPRL
jgi:hypothetical protein